MPTQVYACPIHGEFDVTLSFKDEVPETSACPECGECAQHIIKVPAGIKMARDWNELANEQQRDPYTQAKAQAWNTYHERTERGLEAQKPSERMIQEGAKHIAKDQGK